jgi:hypothetical protein
MAYWVYRRDDGTDLHVRDTRGNHWTLGENWRGGDVKERHPGDFIDTWRERSRREPTIVLRDVKSHGSSRAHSRIAQSPYYYDYIRGFGHGLANLLTQEGSWAWLSGLGDVKRQSKKIKHSYVPSRTQGTVMKASTELETNERCSATKYARLGHGSFLTRGHSAIRYEWCHLVAHGMGGKDVPENLVAATCYQNTEQFIIECVLYGYRMEGFSVHVAAKLAKGTLHLAETIEYSILLGNEILWEVRMDARRATQPTWSEYDRTARSIRSALNDGLVAKYESNTNLTVEQLEYIEKNLAPISADDGSESFWG